MTYLSSTTSMITSNRNTRGNYAAEQAASAAFRNWQLYPHGAGGVALQATQPGNGLGAARMPSHLLSDNATDLESAMRGLGSLAHLETGEAPKQVNVSLTSLGVTSLYETEPIYMPVPLAVPKGQRPMRR